MSSALLNPETRAKVAISIAQAWPPIRFECRCEAKGVFPDAVAARRAGWDPEAALCPDCRTKKAMPKIQLDWTGGAILKGSRHKTLIEYAHGLRMLGLGNGNIRWRLLSVNARFCLPVLGEDRIEYILRHFVPYKRLENREQMRAFLAYCRECHRGSVTEIQVRKGRYDIELRELDMDLCLGAYRAERDRWRRAVEAIQEEGD